MTDEAVPAGEEPTRPVPAADGPPRVTPAPPVEPGPPPPPAPPPSGAAAPPPAGPPYGPPPRAGWAWGRPRNRVLPLVLVGVVGLLLGCMIGGGFGFVAGHFVGRPGVARVHPGWRYGQYPGPRAPYRGPRFVPPGQPVKPVPSPSQS